MAQSIGVIICSTRTPRICPQVTDFVIETITSATSPPPNFTIIDLETWNLPMYNEFAIPQETKDPSKYTQPHTRAWSAEISKYDSFIFVTPQYNWGYPAVIKNAVDYLYHEWAGKPAMIVSYGGHGGGKAAAQLKQVLEAVRMKPSSSMPAFKFPSRDVHEKAARGEAVVMGGKGGIWEGERDTIRKAFGEFMGTGTVAGGLRKLLGK